MNFLSVEKSEYVQYQAIDGEPAPPLLLMSVKVFLVLRQNRPCPIVCPFLPFCNPHSVLLMMILKDIV